MITVSIDPIIFSIGHFHLRWYSVIVMLAIGIAFWLVTREAVRKGFSKEAIYELAIWGGLVGGFVPLVIFGWRKRWNLARLLDAFAPGVVLGQAIGRFACII